MSTAFGIGFNFNNPSGTNLLFTTFLMTRWTGQLDLLGQTQLLGPPRVTLEVGAPHHMHQIPHRTTPFIFSTEIKTRPPKEASLLYQHQVEPTSQYI